MSKLERLGQAAYQQWCNEQEGDQPEWWGHVDHRAWEGIAQAVIEEYGRLKATASLELD